MTNWRGSVASFACSNAALSRSRRCSHPRRTAFGRQTKQKKILIKLFCSALCAKKRLASRVPPLISWKPLSLPFTPANYIQKGVSVGDKNFFWFRNQKEQFLYLLKRTTSCVRMPFASNNLKEPPRLLTVIRWGSNLSQTECRVFCNESHQKTLNAAPPSLVIVVFEGSCIVASARRLSIPL